jgi:hypothetical protein
MVRYAYELLKAKFVAIRNTQIRTRLMPIPKMNLVTWDDFYIGWQKNDLSDKDLNGFWLSNLRRKGAHSFDDSVSQIWSEKEESNQFCQFNSHYHIMKNRNWRWVASKSFNTSVGFYYSQGKHDQTSNNNITHKDRSCSCYRLELGNTRKGHEF